MAIKIIKKAYHRNGIAGSPFVVSIFEHDGHKMVGVRFAETGHTAVFNLKLLSESVIEFGENSFRGDHFEDDLPKPSDEN